MRSAEFWPAECSLARPFVIAVPIHTREDRIYRLYSLFLDESQRAVEHYDSHDSYGIDGLANGDGYTGGHHKNDDQSVGKLPQEDSIQGTRPTNSKALGPCC